MGTTTTKANDDAVQRYVSVARTINSVDDMREFIAAHDDMLERNPGLTKESFELIDSSEYLSSVTDY